MDYKLDTLAIHGGQSPEPVTGAVMTPIFQTSTYAQPHPADWPWEYARTQNPTRTAYKIALLLLRSLNTGFVFSSGVSRNRFCDSRLVSRRYRVFVEMTYMVEPIVYLPERGLSLV